MKRARTTTSPPLVPVPEWLQESGIPDEHLRTLMAWLTKKGRNICDGGGSIACHRRGNHDHVVVLVELTDDHPDETVLACATCAVTCDCCGQLCASGNEIEDDGTIPHSVLCAQCYNDGDPVCTHAFPFTCPCCERGCRELEYTEGDDRKGYHPTRCRHCVDEVCTHDA